MLVLSRKQGEQILIGDKIKVTVVRISGNIVQLGIQAPPEIRIVRDDAKTGPDGQPLGDQQNQVTMDIEIPPTSIKVA